MGLESSWAFSLANKPLLRQLTRGGGGGPGCGKGGPTTRLEVPWLIDLLHSMKPLGPQQLIWLYVEALYLAGPYPCGIYQSTQALQLVF